MARCRILAASSLTLGITGIILLFIGSTEIPESVPLTNYTRTADLLEYQKDSNGFFIFILGFPFIGVSLMTIMYIRWHLDNSPVVPAPPSSAPASAPASSAPSASSPASINPQEVASKEKEHVIEITQDPHEPRAAYSIFHLRVPSVT